MPQAAFSARLAGLKCLYLVTRSRYPDRGRLRSMDDAVNRRRNLTKWRNAKMTISRLCWDDESWSTLTARHVQLARDAGALSELPTGLCERASYQASAGELTAAAATIDEASAIAEVVGSATSFWLAPYVIATLEGRPRLSTESRPHTERQSAPATKHGSRTPNGPERSCTTVLGSTSKR